MNTEQEIKQFADSILIMPDFPIREGLPKDYPLHFSKLCALMKEIYLDIAKDPELWGVISARKLFDFFSCLAKSGVVKNQQLAVCADSFKKEVKKAQSTGSAPVTKYELIISKLADSGFVFTSFAGKPFGKDVAEFTVEYPDYPPIIETMKQFYDCWEDIRKDMKEKKGDYVFWNANHHDAYRFYYLVAADSGKISMLQRISDLAHFRNAPANVTEFQKAFYEYSQRYDAIRYEGHYNYKSKLVIFNPGFWGLSQGESFRIKIRKMSGYTSEIEKMPEVISEAFSKDYQHCKGCNEGCSYRVSWTYKGEERKGCANICFTFSNCDLSLIPHYWRLIELEFGLASAMV